ncbi:hypothetical protein IL306_004939 [Fusarium sp. DS 682]|nr:hypothetical protein IL306_004939 [Fusarium sp. DS 682]
MEYVYAELEQRALGLLTKSQRYSQDSRVIIVLAVPPGSGKSTIAAQVVHRINAFRQTPIAKVLPMDGFHYSRAFLDSLPNHIEAHARRGAYWTFDGQGVSKMVNQLHATRKRPLTALYVPSFDHEIKDPILDAIEISPEVKIVIAEGNWLLYNQHPWNQIADYADETWFVDVDPELALQRVAKRHVSSGIEDTLEAALARARDNDMRNGDEIRASLIQPNITVESIGDA